MYGYEYEDDILLFLRLIKFLQVYHPEVYERIIKFYPPVCEDDMYVIVDDLLWAFLDEAPNNDENEEDGLTVVRLSDEVIDQLYAQGFKGNHLFPCKVGAWQEKIKDVFCFFVARSTNSVYNAKFHFCGGSVTFDITLSLDCYEPLEFLNSIVDMLLYCHRELRRLERGTTDKAIEYQKEAA